MSKPCYGDRNYDLLMQSTAIYLLTIASQSPKQWDGDTCDVFKKLNDFLTLNIQKWSKARSIQSDGGRYGAFQKRNKIK